MQLRLVSCQAQCISFMCFAILLMRLQEKILVLGACTVQYILASIYRNAEKEDII